MPAAERILALALGSVAALGLHAPGSAQPTGRNVAEDAAASEMRAQTTYKTVLEALLKRRAEVARMPDNQAALEFLDNRIAEVRNSLAK